jgi:hypothetical protein
MVKMSGQLNQSLCLSSKKHNSKLGLITSLSLRQISRIEDPSPKVKDQVDFAHIATDLKKFIGKETDLQKLYEERKASKMESLKHLYRMGRGPSSSHTIGPRRCFEFNL